MAKKKEDENYRFRSYLKTYVEDEKLEEKTSCGLQFILQRIVCANLVPKINN